MGETNLKAARLQVPTEDLLPEAIQVQTRGYMAKELVVCTLPHSDPGDLPAWTRTNGKITLGIQPGYDYKKGASIGLPYGSIPRLLLFWITSEAVRTHDRKIKLGNTLNEFLRDVGLNPNTGGGKRGDAKRLRSQMDRLFRAKISFEYHDDARDAWVDMQVAPKGELWWDFQNPGQSSFFDSWIELGETFFQAITQTPVPLDTAALRSLKRSPLALDLYAWVTYRTFTLRHSKDKRAMIPYQALKWQFGAEYSRMDNFKAALKDGMEKVAEVYPDVKYDFGERGLVLAAAPPAVQPSLKKQLPSYYRTEPLALMRETRDTAKDIGPTWDIAAMVKEWRTWVKKEGIEVRDPDAHFLSFIREHVRKNGR